MTAAPAQPAACRRCGQQAPLCRHGLCGTCADHIRHQAGRCPGCFACRS